MGELVTLLQTETDVSKLVIWQWMFNIEILKMKWKQRIVKLKRCIMHPPLTHDENLKFELHRDDEWWVINKLSSKL